MVKYLPLTACSPSRHSSNHELHAQLVLFAWRRWPWWPWWPPGFQLCEVWRHTVVPQIALFVVTSAVCFFLHSEKCQHTFFHCVYYFKVCPILWNYRLIFSDHDILARCKFECMFKYEGKPPERMLNIRWAAELSWLGGQQACFSGILLPDVKELQQRV